MLALLASSAFADPLVAIVVVDQEARDQGYALELEDLVVDDALPVDVSRGEQVRIVDPDGVRHELDVAPGEAWEVTGPQGEAWMSRLGEDVRTDVLVVRGDGDAVKSLAEALGAEIRVDDGKTLLVRQDILFDAPWARGKGLDRLDEIRFVRVHPSPTGEQDTRQQAVATLAAPAVTRESPVAAAAVGPVAAAVAAVATPAEPKANGRKDRTATRDGSEAGGPDRPWAVAALDPTPYVGMYYCGDGTPLVLSGSGGFAAPDVQGDWFVSAPGVIHLSVGGVDWGRAAIESDRRYCHAVW